MHSDKYCKFRPFLNSLLLKLLSSLCRYFAEHDKATALQMLHDSLQPKHKYVSTLHLNFLRT